MDAKSAMVLSAKMQDNDANAETVGEYLRKVLTMLWREGEGFSSKRPFGNSAWQYEVYAALISAEVIAGSLDEYGYVDRVDVTEADGVIVSAVEIHQPAHRHARKPLDAD